MTNNKKTVFKQIRIELKESFSQMKINLTLFLLLLVYSLSILIKILHDLSLFYDLLIIGDVFKLTASIIGAYLIYKKSQLGYIILLGLVSFQLSVVLFGSIFSLPLDIKQTLERFWMLLSRTQYLVSLIIAFIIFRRHVIKEYKIKVWMIILTCAIMIIISFT